MYQKYETERFLLIHFLFLYCPVEIYKGRCFWFALILCRLNFQSYKTYQKYFSCHFCHHSQLFNKLIYNKLEPNVKMTANEIKTLFYNKEELFQSYNNRKRLLLFDKSYICIANKHVGSSALWAVINKCLITVFCLVMTIVYFER